MEGLMSQQNDQTNTPRESILPAMQPLRRLSSNELFDGKSRVVIEHGGIEYLLQITRQGKLILTK